MRAQLTITEGKQKGRTIVLSEPVFVIGRGERCHLRPASELVSREHAEFALKDNSLILRDMGSRNGTLVNGKALTAPLVLKNGDQVQVGPLIFSVSIQGGGAAEKGAAKSGSTGKRSRGQLKSKDLPDQSDAPPAQPSEVQGGSTIMIPAFKSTSPVTASSSQPTPKPKAAPTKPASKSASDVGQEIMSKMLDRKRAKKS